MALQESGEMYLETIYVLSKIRPNVRSIDISDHMGYSKPSVSRAVSILKKGGYILVDKDGFITLTDSGRGSFVFGGSAQTLPELAAGKTPSSDDLLS